MSFIPVMAKLNFQQPLLQSLVSHFRNHSNRLIWCSRNISYLIFFVETVIPPPPHTHIFSLNRKLKRTAFVWNTIIVFNVTIDKLNAFLMTKILISFKKSYWPQMFEPYIEISIHPLLLKSYLNRGYYSCVNVNAEFLLAVNILFIT